MFSVSDNLLVTIGLVSAALDF